MSEETDRLQKLRDEIRAEREALKKEREAAAAAPPQLVNAVSLNVTHMGLKLYTPDGQLINSITWEDLEEMRKQTDPTNYVITDGQVSHQTNFRETFQNFMYFCNHIYLPPEIENLEAGMVNDTKIDPNTRAFIDMIIHYEMGFEKSAWKVPFSRFFKWMCYLFKEDKLIRERVGWMFWWWIVKHGNKMIMWEPMFDPKHWTPYTEDDIARDIEGVPIAARLTEEQQKAVIKENEALMRHGTENQK